MKNRYSTPPRPLINSIPQCPGAPLKKSIYNRYSTPPRPINSVPQCPDAPLRQSRRSNPLPANHRAAINLFPTT
jgi:hypothetical protein